MCRRSLPWHDHNDDDHNDDDDNDDDDNNDDDNNDDDDMDWRGAREARRRRLEARADAARQARLARVAQRWAIYRTFLAARAAFLAARRRARARAALQVLCS